MGLASCALLGFAMPPLTEGGVSGSSGNSRGWVGVLAACVFNAISG